MLHIRPTLHQAHRLGKHARLLVIFLLPLGSRQSLLINWRYRQLHLFQTPGCILHPGAQRIIGNDAGKHLSGLFAETRTHLRIRIACFIQRIARFAEQRILVHQRIQPVRGRWIHLPSVIEIASHKFVVCQTFLNVPQFLHRVRHELAVRELHYQCFALVFSAQRLYNVPVALIHLLIVDIANTVLRLGGLFHTWIKEDEVLVFGFGLRHSIAAAFPEPTVGNRQLRLCQEFARLIRVHQSLQRDAGNFIAAVFDITHGGIEQHLVRLLRVLRYRRFVLLAYTRRKKRCR